MGKRGEGWVILQVLLLLTILFAPRIVSLGFPWWIRVLGGVMIITAMVVLTVGALALGRSLTPFPRPVPNGQLITGSIYGIVRHPLYTALIVAAIGWGVLSDNLLAIALGIVLFVFFDLKSRREEKWLMQAYPDYASYRRRVKKLIPWVY
jgi:protein-S-isoprenylcysteine O-methyltransferase Ste14